jgi:hypothetical protein
MVHTFGMTVSLLHANVFPWGSLIFKNTLWCRVFIALTVWRREQLAEFHCLVQELRLQSEMFDMDIRRRMSIHVDVRGVKAP